MGCFSSKALADDGREKLLDKYTLGPVIGQGAFGIVYSCNRKKDKMEFAVKMVDQVETPLSEIKREVAMLERLKHPSIVKLHDTYYERVFVCLVFEIYRGKDMIEGMQLHWKNKGVVPVPVIQNMAKMMMEGIAWLHQNNVVHRDLKGDNYLMDRKELEHPACRTYLSDFGTVVDIQPGERLVGTVGTKTYWSPEFYAGRYGKAVDIWAAGVILFGMVSGRFPFKGELDVKTRQVKAPSRLSEAGRDFILKTLIREEDKRITARTALEHEFLSSFKSAIELAQESKQETQEEEPEQDFAPDIKEQNVNAGVNDRRQELVERLQEAQERRDVRGSRKQSTTGDIKAWQLKPAFEVTDRQSSKITQFKWVSSADYESLKLVDVEAQVMKEDISEAVKMAEKGTRQMFEQHGINLGAFGQGSAKELGYLVKEVQTGQSRLMLDAARHKAIVRVVEVVAMRIFHPKTKQYLIVTATSMPDGRPQASAAQLPGTKRFPYENAMMTAQRMLADRMNMKDCKIVFSENKESFENDEMSTSFPGVRTVYRKEIYEGRLTCEDPKVLQGIGLGGAMGGSFNWQDPDAYTRTFTWMTEGQCKEKNVPLHAPADSADFSALVHSPIGLDLEELQGFLESNNIDVSKFGKDGVKSMAEFSDELVRGDAALVHHQDGRITRVVDVVVLKIRKANGDILVEAGSFTPGGIEKMSTRLPAVKRRSDENMFWAAQRCINKVLKISENTVMIDHTGVLMIEENSVSKTYADLPTTFRKRIISCSAVEV